MFFTEEGGAQQKREGGGAVVEGCVAIARLAWLPRCYLWIIQPIPVWVGCRVRDADAEGRQHHAPRPGPPAGCAETCTHSLSIKVLCNLLY